MRAAITLVAILLSIGLKPAVAEPDDTDVEIQASIGASESTTAADPDALNKIVAETMQSDFVAALNTKRALAFTDDDVKKAAELAKRSFKEVQTQAGDPNTTYDVVIQIGHYDRKLGRTGGQGTYVNEQEIAALVARSMSDRLSKLEIEGRPVKFVVVKADNYASNLKSTLFVSLHTDSHVSPCSVGPSVGFDPQKSAVGMHFFALALALTLDLDAEKFMKDNYTDNLKGYYAYRRSGATYAAGVLEMSELTCPDHEKRLLANAEKLANNLAVAVQFAVRDRNRK